MIVIRVNLADQRPFDLRSPLNGCRDCEVVFTIKFDVAGTQSGIRSAVVDMNVAKIT